MPRSMVDCTHAELPSVNISGFDLVAGYDTGSSDVKWTATDWQQVALAKKIAVNIDQGYTGSPVSSDVVRDVEPGAWSAIIAETEKPWTAARPTIYCDRTDMYTVINLGWTKDLWLAWPQNSPPSKTAVLAAYPILKKVNLVGVQWKTTSTHDESVIYDNTWPKPKVVTEVVKYPNVPGEWLGPLAFYPGINGHILGVGTGLDYNIWQTLSTDSGKTWGPVVRV